jgi:predicted negative regulator of RcsB-dependent stress response
MKHLLLICLALVKIGSAQELYSAGDTFYLRCKDYYQRNELSKIDAAISTQLKSGHPHPFSYTYWIKLREIKSDYNAAIENYSGQTKLDLEQYWKLAGLYQKGNTPLFIQWAYENHSLLEKDYYWSYNLSTDIRSVHPDSAYPMLLHFFHLFPHAFAPLRAISYMMQENKNIFDEVKRSLNSGEFDLDGDAKQYLVYICKGFPVSDYQLLNGARQYKEHHLNDPLVYRFIAQKLENSEHYTEAAAFFIHSAALDPLYQTNLIEASKCFANNNQYDSAQKILSRQIFSSIPDVQTRKIRSQWISILMDVQDYGSARNTLGKYSRNDVDDYYNLWGRLEMASNRLKEAALAYKTALEQDSSDKTAIVGICDAYSQLKQDTKSVQLLKQARSYLPFSEDLYSHWFSAELALEHYNIARDILKEAVSIYPGSPWIRDNYASGCAQSGDTAEAVRQLEISISLAGYVDLWRTARLVYWTAFKSNDNAKAVETILSQQKSHYEDENFWYYLMLLTPNVSEKKKILREAIQYNKQKVFPLNHYLDICNTKSDYREALRLFDLSAPDILQSGLDGEIVQFYHQRSRLGVNQAADIGLDSVSFSTAVAADSVYRLLGGAEADYWSDLSLLYKSQNEIDSASAYMVHAAILRPNEKRFVNLLWADYEHPKKFQLYKKFYDRNPYDHDRAKNFMEYNVRWGGSDLVGHQAVQDFKVHFPNLISEATTRETFVLDHFKDYRDFYNTMYRHSTSLSDSRRYIGWYEHSRENSWQGSATCTFSDSACSVTIENEDGTSYVRADDPACGKIAMLRIGDVYIRQVMIIIATPPHSRARTGQK